MVELISTQPTHQRIVEVHNRCGFVTDRFEFPIIASSRSGRNCITCNSDQATKVEKALSVRGFVSVRDEPLIPPTIAPKAQEGIPQFVRIQEPSYERNLVTSLIGLIRPALSFLIKELQAHSTRSRLLHSH
jgi:hypothetical protein